MGLAELLPAALLLATAGSAIAVVALRRRLADSAALLHRSRARLLELERLQAARRAGAMQAVAEEAVEGGTRIVQGVHHGIAAIPFGVLEAIPLTRAPTRVVRTTHNLIANGVYGTISVVNRGIGRLLRGPIKKPPDRPE